MVFLGSDRSEAINKIQASNEKRESPVSVIKSENGYATLVFPYNKKQAWSYLGWALDELYIDIEDRDVIEGSYFINVTPVTRILIENIKHCFTNSNLPVSFKTT